MGTKRPGGLDSSYSNFNYDRVLGSPTVYAIATAPATDIFDRFTHDHSRHYSLPKSFFFYRYHMSWYNRLPLGLILEDA